MPKRVFKIPNFDRGIIGNAEKRDLPNNAMTYGENVDSRVSGQVRGIKSDTLENINFDARVMTTLLGDTDLLIGQDQSGQFKEYDIDGDSVSNIGSATSDFAKTMTPQNRAVFVGMTDSFRSGDPGTAKWIGDIDHGQFDVAAPSGRQLDDAECKSYYASQIYADTSASPYIQFAVNDGFAFVAGALVTWVNEGGSSVFEANTSYYWAISLVYDGFQESPLIKGIVDTNGNLRYYFWSSTTSGAGAVSLILGFGQNSAGDISRRVSHINLYRATSETDVPGTYSFVKQFELDQTGTASDYEEFHDTGMETSGATGTGTTFTVNDAVSQTIRIDDVIRVEDEKMLVTSVDYVSDTLTVTRGYEGTSNVSHADGTVVEVAHDRIHSTTTAIGGIFAGGTYTDSMYFVRLYDDGSTGAEFIDNAGFPSTLETSGVNYSLSAELGSYLFVADCSKTDISNASKYVFRSAPLSYSVFNWSEDFLQLPERPVAMAGFGGRLYAFSSTNMYRINPDFLQLEDEFRGVGCLNENCVVVTNFGMYHADKNNIYFNDGRSSVPIGTAILENQWDTIGWSQLAHTSIADEAYASLQFDPVNRRLLCFGTTSGTDLIVWAYDIQRERWDHYPTLGLVSTTAVGPAGKVFAVIGDTVNGFDLYSLFTSGTRKNWTVRTKDFDFDSDTGYVYLYDLSAYGSGNLDIDYYVNGGGTPAGPTTSTVDSFRQATVASGDKKSRSIVVEVSSAATSDTLDNITVQFRPQVIQE